MEFFVTPRQPRKYSTIPSIVFGPILQVHELGHWLEIHVIHLSITQVLKGSNICEGDLVHRNTARNPFTVADEVAAELQVVLGMCRDALSGLRIVERSVSALSGNLSGLL